jgi:hypothetical protein
MERGATIATAVAADDVTDETLLAQFDQLELRMAKVLSSGLDAAVGHLDTASTANSDGSDPAVASSGATAAATTERRSRFQAAVLERFRGLGATVAEVLDVPASTGVVENDERSDSVTAAASAAAGGSKRAKAKTAAAATSGGSKRAKSKSKTATKDDTASGRAVPSAFGGVAQVLRDVLVPATPVAAVGTSVAAAMPALPPIVVMVENGMQTDVVELSSALLSTSSRVARSRPSVGRRDRGDVLKQFDMLENRMKRIVKTAKVADAGPATRADVVSSETSDGDMIMTDDTDDDRGLASPAKHELLERDDAGFEQYLVAKCEELVSSVATVATMAATVDAEDVAEETLLAQFDQLEAKMTKILAADVTAATPLLSTTDTGVDGATSSTITIGTVSGSTCAASNDAVAET